MSNSTVAPAGEFVEVEGRRIHVVARGAARPTVVIVTGGGEPASLAAALQERIAPLARAWAYDRPGLGWSDPAPHPLSFPDQARWLHNALACSGEKAPYVVVAASFGGLVARAFAAAYPHEVAGVVLVDAVEEEHIFPRLERLLSATRKQLVLTRLLTATGLMGAVVRRSVGRALPSDARRQLQATLTKWPHWKAAAAEVMAYSLTPPPQRIAAGFGRLPVPLTVVAHGRPLTGPNATLEEGWRQGQERLAALSEQARFVVAETSGHAILQEAPDLVVAEVTHLVDQVRAETLSSIAQT